MNDSIFTTHEWLGIYEALREQEKSITSSLEHREEYENETELEFLEQDLQMCNHLIKKVQGILESISKKINPSGGDGS